MTARPDVRTIRNLHDAHKFVWREFALKVKLAVKLLWARMTAQRILKAVVKAVVNIVTTVAYNAALADYDSDWPASPFVPSLPISQHATPAASVGAQASMKALAEKGKTAAFTPRVTAADVERVQGIEGTRQILDAEKHAKRKMDSKSLASFNNSPRQGKGVRYHSRYGDDMRKVKAEAGLP